MTGADGDGLPLERRDALPADRRSGIALCLSGGGSRAALFHLGVVRRLDEVGVLSQVRTISSVSGGTILAAHLARRIRPWPTPNDSTPAYEVAVAAPFRRFVQRN